MNFRVKELRINNKYTQADIAEQLGITQQAYANYESGKREPDNETLIKLADFFNVSIDYLLGKSEFKNFDEMLEAYSKDVEMKKPINEDELDKELLELLTNLNDDDIPVVEAFLSALTKRHGK